MASSTAKGAPAARNHSASSKKTTTTTRPRRARRSPLTRKLIDDVTAILLISPNAARAKKLCAFYRETLGIPLEEEAHDGMPLHYGYALGDVQFAIHPAAGWPGVATRNARSPVIGFSTSHLQAVIARLAARGVKVIGPTDHGFAHGISFRDPDGNHVSVFEYGPEYW